MSAIPIIVQERMAGFITWSNTDLTEGKGESIPICYSFNQVHAENAGRSTPSTPTQVAGLRSRLFEILAYCEGQKTDDTLGKIEQVARGALSTTQTQASVSEDKKRLDWLEAHHDKYWIDCNLAFSTPFRIMYGNIEDYKSATVISSGQDLRQAIDFAISQTQ